MRWRAVEHCQRTFAAAGDEWERRGERVVLRQIAAQNDLEDEATPDIREQQCDEADERPAQRTPAAPAIGISAGEQQAENDPRDDREQGLVVEAYRLAEQLLREDHASNERQGEQREAKGENPEQ